MTHGRLYHEIISRDYYRVILSPMCHGTNGFCNHKQPLHDIGGHDVSGSAVYLVQQFCDGEL